MSFEPLLTNEEAEYNAPSVLFAACFFCCLHYRRGDDVAVWYSDAVEFELAGNHGFDLIFETEGNLGNLLRWYGGRYIVFISRKDFGV